jgi:hypothetical protein
MRGACRSATWWSGCLSSDLLLRQPPLVREMRVRVLHHLVGHGESDYQSTAGRLCGLTLGSCASKVAIVLVNSKLGHSHDLIAASIVLQDCARLPLHSWRGSDSTLLVHLRNLHFIQRCAYTWQAMTTVKRADAQPDSAATVGSTHPLGTCSHARWLVCTAAPSKNAFATFGHHS